MPDLRCRYVDIETEMRRKEEEAKHFHMRLVLRHWSNLVRRRGKWNRSAWAMRFISRALFLLKPYPYSQTRPSPAISRVCACRYVRKLLKEWHEIAKLQKWRSNNIAHMRVKVYRRLQVCSCNWCAHARVPCVHTRVYLTVLALGYLHCAIFPRSTHSLTSKRRAVTANWCAPMHRALLLCPVISESCRSLLYRVADAGRCGYTATTGCWSPGTTLQRRYESLPRAPCVQHCARERGVSGEQIPP